MSSKSIQVCGASNQMFNLTYGNVGNWPRTPEYRNYNNKALLFCPNPACTVASAGTTHAYYTQYMTNFKNK